ncbi:flagellar protein [Tepidibacillus marianensis]|uniref:flagellar protein n=1 Tax=Tepidibacillus marianensis TaxID=3131995 RepID=UPI0030CE5E51
MMGLGNIQNCPRCGKIFVKGIKEVCPTCNREIDEEYQRCVDYIRDNKLVNMYVLSDETKVSIKQITKFIKEGRISVADLPELTYPCESCGEPIREGKLCKSCRDRLEKGIKQAIEKHGPNEETNKGIGFRRDFLDKD